MLRILCELYLCEIACYRRVKTHRAFIAFWYGIFDIYIYILRIDINSILTGKHTRFDFQNNNII